MPIAFGSRFAAQRAELLRRVAKIGFFQNLSESERQNLLMNGVMHNYSNGQVIFEENSLKDQAIYFIVSGEVEIQLDGYEKSGSSTVATLKVGEIFGEMTMFNNQPRSATTRSKGSSAILLLDLKKMMNDPLANPSPDLTIKILSHIASGLCNKLSHMNKVLLHTIGYRETD